MKQDQIYAEEEDVKNEQEEKVDMREFLKDAQNLHHRVKYANNVVVEQDKKLVQVNEKLDDYNEDVDHGEDLLNIVNKGVFGSIVDGIKGLFKPKKKHQYDLNSKEKKILKKAKNKESEKYEEDNYNNLGFKEEGDWSIIKKDKYSGDDKYDEDEVIEDSIKEFQKMTKSLEKFNKNVKESKKVIKVTNDHIDKSDIHVNNAFDKMKIDKKKKDKIKNDKKKIKK